MNEQPAKMQGRPKVCPRCMGECVVEVPRQQAALEGFLGGVRLPCPRCHMRGWVEESEIDCEATGVW